MTTRVRGHAQPGHVAFDRLNIDAINDGILERLFPNATRSGDELIALDEGGPGLTKVNLKTGQWEIFVQDAPPDLIAFLSTLGTVGGVQ